MKIIKYRLFKNCEEFVEFQKEYYKDNGEELGIINISPIASYIGFDFKENNAEGSVNISVFVTYII